MGGVVSHRTVHDIDMSQGSGVSSRWSKDIGASPWTDSNTKYVLLIYSEAFSLICPAILITWMHAAGYQLQHSLCVSLHLRSRSRNGKMVTHLPCAIQ